MIALETILLKNSIVQRLIADGNISRENLKKIYRACCKLTHPDLHQRDGGDFIQLRTEYEQALRYWDDLAALLLQKDDTTLLQEADLRRMFYAALRHYLAAGLYSPRVRIKPEMKKRNELILKEVLNWAKFYRPSFVAVFLEYNKTYLRRYTEWRKRDQLVKAQKLFVLGCRNALEYEAGRKERALRAARSLFGETLSVLEITPPSAPGRALTRCAAWFLSELETLSLRISQERGNDEQ